MNSHRWCKTVDSEEINLFDPDPALFTVERIANALARINRFAGHWEQPVSVARHSIRVARLLRHTGHGTETQLQGLFHDAAEAFTTDIPSPLKSLLFVVTPIKGQVIHAPGFDYIANPEPNCKSYREFEDDLLCCIFGVLEIAWPLRSAVHEIDKQLTEQECKWVRGEDSDLYRNSSTDPKVIARVFKVVADDLFAARLREHANDMRPQTIR